MLGGMRQSVLARLSRLAVRVPRHLWRLVVVREARRAGHHIEWMTPAHHQLRDFAVTEIIRTAEPVSPEQFAAGTGVAVDLVSGLLTDLEKRKTFVFRSDGVNVDWAYPVTATETPHRIRLDSGERFFAA